MKKRKRLFSREYNGSPNYFRGLSLISGLIFFGLTLVTFLLETVYISEIELYPLYGLVFFAISVIPPRLLVKSMAVMVATLAICFCLFFIFHPVAWLLLLSTPVSIMMAKAKKQSNPTPDITQNPAEQ